MTVEKPILIVYSVTENLMQFVIMNIPVNKILNTIIFIKLPFLIFWLDWIQLSSVQLLSHVQLFVTPWTAGRQASLSITISQRLPKLMSIESVMPSTSCH